MKRRELIAASGALCVLAAARSFAQAPKAPRRIGWLMPGAADSFKLVAEAFAAKLKELGYVEGRDYVIEKRMSEGRLETLAPLARELVALKPDVLLTASHRRARARGRPLRPEVLGGASAAGPGGGLPVECREGEAAGGFRARLRGNVAGQG